MAEDQLRLELRDGAYPDEQVLALEGFLKAETAFRVREVLNRHEPATLIIDMTGVRSVDSSGLGVLIGLYASYERNSRRLLLTGLNDRIWDLFRMCKIDDVFTRYPTVADAERTVETTAEQIISGEPA